MLELGRRQRPPIAAWRAGGGKKYFEFVLKVGEGPFTRKSSADIVSIPLYEGGLTSETSVRNAKNK